MEAPQGLLYQYWNNVDTMPGRGYPRGIFTPLLGGGFDPVTGQLNISGQFPSVEADYGAPWEYNYSDVLRTEGGEGPTPMMTPSPAPDGPNAYSSNWDEDVATGTWPQRLLLLSPEDLQSLAPNLDAWRPAQSLRPTSVKRMGLF